MSETDLIPARHADIFWNDEPKKDPEDSRRAGHEVVVLNRDPALGRRSLDTDPGHNCSHGSMVAGWLEDGHQIHNPAGLFAYNWLAKGSSPESIHAALREFAKIEECVWAREMLAAVEWHNRPDEPIEY